MLYAVKKSKNLTEIVKTEEEIDEFQCNFQKNVTCRSTFSLENTVLEKPQERGRDQIDLLPFPQPKYLQVAGKVFATQCFFHKSFEPEN